jgi:HAMP domain-containing protein
MNDDAMTLPARYRKFFGDKNMTHGADVTAKELAERLRFHADAFGAISLTGHLFRQAADELDRLAGEVERLRDGWEEAAIAWEVCASIHREYAKKRDPFFTTRQGDFTRGADKARAALEGIPPEAGTTGGRTGAG